MQQESFIKLFLARWLFSGLMGLTFSDWWSLLRKNNFRVHPFYWPRAVLISVSSVMTSVLKKLEERKYKDKILVKTMRSPIIIIGHWRSGTTHLHNLLSLSPGFITPNFYEVMNPHIFLTCEKAMTSLWRRMLTRTRVIDPMPLDLTSPQEEEFALALLSLHSPYLSYCFPDAWNRYGKFLTFEGCTSDEIAHWLQSLDTFLRKLSLKNSDGQPLLKSPASTGRLSSIIKLYPEAKFLHICRDPMSVFASTRHMLETSIPFMQMQRLSLDRLDDIIISRYNDMYDAYFHQKNELPRNQIYEIRYEDLARSPIETIKNVFLNLDLSSCSDFQERLRSYLQSIDGYCTQKYAPLPPTLKNRLRKEWGRCFEAWGYKETI